MISIYKLVPKTGGNNGYDFFTRESIDYDRAKLKRKWDYLYC
jgi:hypothetical protein